MCISEHCGNKKCPQKNGFMSKDCQCWCKRSNDFGEPVALCENGAAVPGGDENSVPGRIRLKHLKMPSLHLRLPRPLSAASVCRGSQARMKLLVMPNFTINALF